MRKTLEGIGYDRVLDNIVNRTAVSNELWTEYEQMSGKRLSYRTISTPAGEQLDVSHITGTPEQTEQVNLARSVALDTAINRKELELVKASHQFILGEATVDSLFNERAKNFSYVDQGKVPFDNFFASFTEPIDLTLPFIAKPAIFDGIHIMRTDSHYRVSGHFQTKDAAKEHYAAHLRLINPSQPRIGGRITNISVHPLEKEVDDSLYTAGFIYDTSSDQLTVIPPTNDITADFNDKPYRLMNHPTPLQAIPEAYLGNRQEVGFDTISNLTNLAVNIINYTNAHNLHIVDKQRTVRVREDLPNGKKGKVREYQLPYSLVVVRDGEMVIEEDRESRSSEMDYRSYVRGHDRRYRNEDRSLRFVGWVNPYVRGPTDKPFRDQKHILLADKLLKEKNWMANLIHS